MSCPNLYLQILSLILVSILPLCPSQQQHQHQEPSPSYPCIGSSDDDNNKSLDLCNSSLPIPLRSRSLLSLLTLPEKLSLLSNSFPALALPGLSIPSFQWWSESLHGLATNGPGVVFSPTSPIPAATQFPQVILTTASFNRSLWRAIPAAIAVEARAMRNAGLAGLTYWAPNINIFRDPRWGRGQETPGEDPLVAAHYAADYVSGFQRMEPDGRMMLSACCKHLIAYDLEKWGSFDRYSFDAEVTQQDMTDTYEPPFRSCVEQGRASCLMCSYNKVNGMPACASSDLLQRVRDDWGFDGYITSDCDAVATVYEYQHYAKSPEDAVALVLKAGLDINCGTYLLRHAESALDLGKITEGDIDRALLNLFSVQLRLGLFDGNPRNQQYGQLGPSDVCTDEHRKLAFEAARQGIVLLKNENGFLPLKMEKVASLAIIGPVANDTSVMGGDYTGVACSPKSFLEGLQEYVPGTSYAAGCRDVPCESDGGFRDAIEVARQAEVVVVVAGLNLTEETEDLDRVTLLLPGRQMDLIRAITDVSKNPIVLVLMGGGPLDVSFAKLDSRIAGILWIGYPGEAGGQVLAEALFGKFNPGGRLPVTWYPESFTRVPMNDMNMRPDPSRDYPGRTYRFYTGETVYEFGYGLSYSTYSYKFISVPEKIRLLSSSSEAHISDGLDFVHVDNISSCDALKFHARVSVENNGDMDGSHVVLLFSRAVVRTRGSPVKQLVGFERVYMEAKGSVEAGILIEPCKHLSTVNEQGERILLLGGHVLMLNDMEHVVHIEI